MLPYFVLSLLLLSEIFYRCPQQVEMEDDILCAACLKPDASRTELPTETKEGAPITPFCVETITINLCGAADLPSHNWRQMVEQLVESILTSFPQIRVLALAFRSRQQMAHFVEYVAEKMTRLLTSGVLRYAVWHSPADEFDPGSWIQVCVDDGQVEGKSHPHSLRTEINMRHVVSASTRDLSEVYK